MNILLLFSSVVVCGTLSMPGGRWAKAKTQGSEGVVDKSNQMSHLQLQKLNAEYETQKALGGSAWIEGNRAVAIQLGLVTPDALQDVSAAAAPSKNTSRSVLSGDALVVQYIDRNPSDAILSMSHAECQELLEAFFTTTETEAQQAWVQALCEVIFAEDSNQQSACAAASSDVGPAQAVQDASVVSGASAGDVSESVTSISQAHSASSVPSNKGSKARVKGTKVDLRALLAPNAAKSNKGSDVAARLAKDAADAEAKKKRELQEQQDLDMAARLTEQGKGLWVQRRVAKQYGQVPEVPLDSTGSEYTGTVSTVASLGHAQQARQSGAQAWISLGGADQPLDSADASGPSSGSASVLSTVLPGDSASNTRPDVKGLAHAARQLLPAERQALIKELMAGEPEPFPEECCDTPASSHLASSSAAAAPAVDPSADPKDYPAINDTRLPKGLEKRRQQAAAASQRALATNASETTVIPEFLTSEDARVTFEQEAQYAKDELISGLDDSSFAQHKDVKNAEAIVKQHIQELYRGRSNPSKTEREQFLWQQDKQYKERGDAESNSEHYHVSLACNRLKYQCTAQPLSQVVEDCGHNANKLARIALGKQRQDSAYSAFLYRLSIRENFRAFQNADEMGDDVLRTKHLYYASYGIHQLKSLLQKDAPMLPLYKQASVMAAKYYRDTAEGLNLMSLELHEALKEQSPQYYKWAADEFQSLAHSEADLVRKVMFATLASECYVKASDLVERAEYLRTALGMWRGLRKRSSNAEAYEYKLECVKMAIPVAEKLDALTKERNANQLKEQQASLQESIRLRNSASSNLGSWI